MSEPTVIITHEDGSQETLEGRVTASTEDGIIVHTDQGDIFVEAANYQEQR